MNILFDLLTCQAKYGAGEYARRVFYALMERLAQEKRKDVRVYALYDSKKGIAYSDLNVEESRTKWDVDYADCSKKTIAKIVQDLKIDVFFIACVQFVAEYPSVEDLTCEVIAVAHDFRDEEFFADKFFEFLRVRKSVYDYKDQFKQPLLNKLRYAWMSCILCKSILALRHKKSNRRRLLFMERFCRLARNNAHTSLVVPSYYTRHSACLHWPWMSDRISVCYSPSRLVAKEGAEVCKELTQFIAGGRKYFLLMSTNRDYKNAEKALRAFSSFQKHHPEYYLLAVGDSSIRQTNVLALPFLSDEDIDAALRNCHALIYPTMFEGFGYPPLEAMRYGKPVLASNVTSIPEVLGSAPIYFSPFYETDIFAALMKFASVDYQTLSSLSKVRFDQVQERQSRDLKRLLDMMVGNHV